MLYYMRTDKSGAACYQTFHWLEIALTIFNYCVEKEIKASNRMKEPDSILEKKEKIIETY